VDQHPHAGPVEQRHRRVGDGLDVGVPNSPLLAQFGPICAGSDAGARLWLDASTYCSDFGLRLPSFSEARALARNYDVPGVSGQQLLRRESLYPAELSGLAALLLAFRDSPLRTHPLNGTCMAHPSRL
jgi:hypothetical protein